MEDIIHDTWSYIKVASASFNSACLKRALAWNKSLIRADFS